MSELTIIKEETIDDIANKVKVFKETGELNFPVNYSPENALKSAWLIIQDLTVSVKSKEKNKYGKYDFEKHLALNACSKKSIANALLDMTIQGLSPAKKQCYFIAYGNELQLQRSYFGTIAVTKRLNDIKDIRSQIIFLDDEIDIEIVDGSKKVTKHIQELENIDIEKIRGAYTVILKHDGSVYTEIMSKKQIEQSWKQSKTAYNIFDDKGTIKPTSVHGKFTDQMCLKTVINRACKNFANTSDDNDVLIDSFNRATDNEYLPDEPPAVLIPEKTIAEKITEEANKEPLEFEEEFPIVNNVIETEFKELTPTTPSVPTEEDERGF